MDKKTEVLKKLTDLKTLMKSRGKITTDDPAQYLIDMFDIIRCEQNIKLKNKFTPNMVKKMNKIHERYEK